MRSARLKSESKITYGLLNHGKGLWLNEMKSQWRTFRREVMWSDKFQKDEYSWCVEYSPAGWGQGWKAGDQLGGVTISQYKKWQGQREVRFWILRFGAQELPFTNKVRLKAWLWENRPSAAYSTWNTDSLHRTEERKANSLRRQNSENTPPSYTCMVSRPHGSVTSWGPLFCFLSMCTALHMYSAFQTNSDRKNLMKTYSFLTSHYNLANLWLFPKRITTPCYWQHCPSHSFATKITIVSNKIQKYGGFLWLL